MKKGKSLKKNFVYNFINEILVLIVPLITTPYLSRVLQEEIIGRISYSNSIVTYFVLFANLGFSIYGQRQIARCRDNQEEKSKAFWEIIILKMIFTTVSLIVLYSISFSVSFGDNYNLYILILSLEIINVYFDFTFLFKGEEEFKTIAIRSIITKLISLIGIFTFVKTKDDVWIYLVFFSGSTLVSNLLMLPAVIKSISKCKISELNLKKHILPSIYIFLPTLAVTIYSVFDKTMIGLLSPNPDYDNGCYDRAYKINSIALVLVSVVSTILLPRNAYEYAKGNYEKYNSNLNFYTNYVFFIGLPLIAGFLVLSNNLSSWYLGEGFADVPLLTKIMAIRFVISGFNVLFNQHVFIIRSEEKIPMISNFSAAAINVALNFILIPYMGAVGAAITTSISELTVCIISGVIAVKKKYVNLPYILKSSIKKIIAAAVMYIPIYFLDKQFGYSIWSFIVITLIGGITYLAVLFILRDKFIIDLFKLALYRKKVKEENDN